MSELKLTGFASDDITAHQGSWRQSKIIRVAINHDKRSSSSDAADSSQTISQSISPILTSADSKSTRHYKKAAVIAVAIAVVVIILLAALTIILRLRKTRHRRWSSQKNVANVPPHGRNSLPPKVSLAYCPRTMKSPHQVRGVDHEHGGCGQRNSIIGYSAISARHSLGGPPGYGRIRVSRHNVSMLSGSSWQTPTDTSINASVNNDSSAHQHQSEPSQISSIVQLFPMPPTTICLGIKIKAYPSPVHSRALSPRGAYLNNRARNRPSTNPFLSARISPPRFSRARCPPKSKTRHSHASVGVQSKATASSVPITTTAHVPWIL